MAKSIYYDENGNEQILSSSPSALSGLLDTDITTPTANQVLAYDGDNWVNSDYIKSILLTGTINCNTADTNTIGYRNTDGNKVNLTTRTGYPTGKTILAYIIEKACITGNSNEGAIAIIDGTILNCNCKTNSICDWAVRVLYID